MPLFIYINNFEVDKHSANVTVFPTFLPGVSMGIFYNHLRSILIANLKQQSRIPEDQQLVFTKMQHVLKISMMSRVLLRFEVLVYNGIHVVKVYERDIGSSNNISPTVSPLYIYYTLYKIL